MQYRNLLILLALNAFALTAHAVPAYVLRLPSSVQDVFIAETSTATLHHFENAVGRARATGKMSYMSIGQSGDGKQRSGDRRTPLGIYFVTERLDTSRMHEKYGPMAFVLDYPNRLDVLAGRTGDGIWLHGVDARQSGRRPRLDTDGCLAIPNDDLRAFENRFVPNTTPVIIGQSIGSVPEAEVESLAAALETAVANWVTGFSRRDVRAYLSLYSEDFRHWQMNRSEWQVLVAELLPQRLITDVSISDLLLLADPVNDGVYLSRFELAVTEQGKTSVLTKRLYWRRSASGALKIIAEDAG